MMMMAIQEGGRVASGIVDSLKTQPLSLALVVMNLALLAILYYAISVSVATRKHEFELMLGSQKEMREAQRDIRANLVPESEMRDVQRTLRTKMDEIRSDLRDCEAKINKKVDDTIKQNGNR
jgi:dsDNA-specific endonuclease/ATPase MutS2